MERYIKQVAYVVLLILLLIFMYGLIVAYRKMNTPVIEIRELAAPAPIKQEPVPLPKSDKPVCLQWDRMQTKSGHLQVCKQWAE